VLSRFREGLGQKTHSMRWAKLKAVIKRWEHQQCQA
jgi:hypothetical protein